MFRPVVTATGLALAGTLALLPWTASAQDGAALQSRIDQLQRDIEALRTELDQRPVLKEEELVRRAPGGGLLIGNTTLTFSGYVKVDMSMSNHGFANGKNYEIITPGALKAINKDQGHRFNMGARQTRFGFATATPVGSETLRTFVAWDFYGDHDSANEFISNGYGPRLREAYGAYGNWLVGQTWSTFTDLNGIGELIAFGQQANVNFVRQAMVRYTVPFQGGHWQFAVENPEDTGSDEQDTPDMVGRLTLNGDWGHVSLAAVVRKLALDNGVDKDHEWADAYSLTGRFPMFDRDDIRLQLNYGNVGRYMGLRVFPDALVEGDEIRGVDAWGASAFYRHYWTETLRSTLAVSTSRIRDGGDYSGTMATRYDSAFLNLMWSPSPRMTYGVEYQYFDMELASGASPDLARLALSAQFNF